jgi:hypothetical protein
MLVAKPEVKRPLGRPGRRWEENLKEILCEDVDWIHLIQNRVQWRPLLNSVTILQVPQKFGDFSPAMRMLVSPKRISSIELVIM